ncbi:MAG: TetR/AcrR family transcriptional regulator [Myxococcota bacterium]
MARYSPEHAEETRRSILSTCTAQIRRAGLSSVRVSALMKSAGLTHGGFYRHFASRDALLMEAATSAMSQGARWLQQALLRKGASLENLAAVYLSEAHRDDPAVGCALPSIGPEVARLPGDARRAFTAALNEELMLIRMQLPLSHPNPDQAAWGVLSAMVGGLILARLVPDEATSRQVLAAARRAAVNAAN